MILASDFLNRLLRSVVMVIAALAANMSMKSLIAQTIQEVQLTSEGKNTPVSSEIPSVSFPEPWASPYKPDQLYGRHFVNSEGRYLYLLSKTAFSYFDCEDPEAFLAKTSREAVNVIRVCLEGLVCRDHDAGDLWPWAGDRANPDLTRFDPVYWKEVKRRVALAGNRGIGIHLILYHTLQPNANDIAPHRAYWQHIIEQLGGYSNLIIWEISSSALENEAFTDEAARYFSDHDPADRAVIATGETSDKPLWPDKSWMDLAVTKLKTGDQPFFGLENWYLATARNLSAFHKPILNAEMGSEVLHNNDDPVFRRKQMWLWTASGGYWTWNSLEGCREMQQKAYYGPGWQYLKPMVEQFNSIEFWRLLPDHTTVSLDNPQLLSTSMSTADKGQLLTYVCTLQSNDYVRNQIMGFRLPEGTFEIQFIRPSDNRPIRTDRMFGTGSMVPAEIQIPDFSNDLLIRIDKIR